MSMKKPQLGMSARKTVGNTVYHIISWSPSASS